LDKGRVFPRPHTHYKVPTGTAHKSVAQHLTGAWRYGRTRLCAPYAIRFSDTCPEHLPRL